MDSKKILGLVKDRALELQKTAGQPQISGVVSEGVDPVRFNQAKYVVGNIFKNLSGKNFEDARKSVRAIEDMAKYETLDPSMLEGAKKVLVDSAEKRDQARAAATAVGMAALGGGALAMKSNGATDDEIENVAFQIGCEFEKMANEDPGILDYIAGNYKMDDSSTGAGDRLLVPFATNLVAQQNPASTYAAQKAIEKVLGARGQADVFSAAMKDPRKIIPAMFAASAVGTALSGGINAVRGHNLAKNNLQEGDYTTGDLLKNTLLPFSSPESSVKRKMRAEEAAAIENLAFAAGEELEKMAKDDPSMFDFITGNYQVDDPDTRLVKDRILPTLMNSGAYALTNGLAGAVLPKTTMNLGGVTMKLPNPMASSISGAVPIALNVMRGQNLAKNNPDAGPYTFGMALKNALLPFSTPDSSTKRNIRNHEREEARAIRLAARKKALEMMPEAGEEYIEQVASIVVDEIEKEALLGAAAGFGTKALSAAKNLGAGVRNYADNLTGSNLRAAKRFESVQKGLVDDAGKVMASQNGLPNKAMMDEAKAHQIGLQKATQGVKDAQAATNKARLATGASVAAVAAGTAGGATVNAVRERARQIEESKGKNYEQGYEFQ